MVLSETVPETFEEARRLVMQWGWNSTAYQILNPGIQHWFNRDRTAVIGYVRRGRHVLAAGGPVCAAPIMAGVLGEFENFAGRVCYVCAEERLRKHFAASASHSIVTLGAQPVWNPANWPAIVEHRASLRAQLSRARNKGVEVEEMDARAAARDPGLRMVLDDWLEGRRLPPMHFMVEPDVLRGSVEDRVVLVAKRAGAAVAYLVASPVALRNGFLIEELARTHRAPNGVIEVLIDSAMHRFAAERRSFVTLGLVALAEGSFDSNPLWLRTMMRFARAHANRFYNFQGLESFRRKMAPDGWERVYLIANERNFSLETLYAVGGAFSRISPVRAVALGALKAVHTEITALRSWVMNRS